MLKFKGHLIDFDKLSDNPVIVDLGACVGEFIDLILKHIKNPTIYAFEPCGSNFKILKESKADKNVFVYKHAVVGENSENEVLFTEFIGLPEWGGIERINVDTKHGKLKRLETYNVSAIKMNELSNFLGYYGNIDYLKMDIEGTETDLIKTMNKETADKIHQISIEIHNNDIDELDKILTDFGFITEQHPGELYGIK